LVDDSWRMKSRGREFAEGKKEKWKKIPQKVTF
jgi:hypothetical protein